VRSWRSSAASSLIAMAMIFWVGSAMSTPTSEENEDPGRFREPTAPIAPTTTIDLLPWPARCWSADGGFHCSDPDTVEPALGEEEWRPEIAPVVRGWRDILGDYFRAGDIPRALRIIDCESSGNPRAVNPSSGAAGLFQQMPRYWASRAASAGFPGASVLDPEANIAASAWLVYHGGGWNHWAASASCWR